MHYKTYKDRGMKVVLVASVYSHQSYSRGIMPDVLQTQIDNNPGAKIFYLTNSNSFDVCYFNTEKKAEICYRCKTAVKNALKLIEGPFEHIKISDILAPEDLEKANEFFSEGETVKMDQVFEEFEVGAATLSTYFSRIRDLDLVDIHRYPFVKELAINALALYLAVKRFMADNKVEIVYNFNGRHGYVRAIMRAAHANKIDCFNLERTRMGGYVDLYKNVLPHSIKYKENLVNKYWNDSSLPEAEKINIGSSFYSRQRAGDSIVYPSYTNGMKEGEVPPEILNGNKNIVAFNSSEDEFASFGEEFENPLFRDQNEGLRYLAEIFGTRLKHYNFIIRMHPNLSGVKFAFVEKIRNLHQSYPNVFVVTPESQYDTYALMEIAEKVVSFGSTTGLEASFRRKPVILLGKCFYYYTNAAYVPKNKEELEFLLVNDLEPRPVEVALKFGFYFMNGGIKTKYYYEDRMGEGVYFKNQLIPFYSWHERIKAKIIQHTRNFRN